MPSKVIFRVENERTNQELTIIWYPHLETLDECLKKRGFSTLARGEIIEKFRKANYGH